MSGFKYCRILFLFSFVLKSEVLKEWGHSHPYIWPIWGQDPHIDQREVVWKDEEELGGKNGVLCGH